jgi:predicted RNA-binding Zn ribbon-like protein
MATTRAQDRFAPDAPFRYVGGDPALDFVNTTNWTPRGLERDRFTTYERVVEWAEGADVLGARQAARLRDRARRTTRAADAALNAAHQARAVLRDLFVGVLSGPPEPAVLNRFNALLSDTASRARLEPAASGGLTRGWSGSGDELESLLWPVVWSAAEVVSATDTTRLGLCAGQDCGWLYMDRSRNQLRRWCEMSVCGTAEKNRRRARRASSREDPRR